ncbi:MAG: hypothetical protein J6M18_03350 [Actinomycetaceae bacterium]|nr:hypothetical protein [Actinomycetaceae bacterium]
MRYQLMNKDQVVGVYEEKYELDEYTYVPVECKEGSYFPYAFSTIDEWIDGRQIAKHRNSIQALMRQLGLDDRHNFIGMVRCLSLTDTFWMKPEDENLTWNDVSLYRNPFDDIVARIAFDGTGMFGRQNSPTSPEFATSGSFAKCWVRDGNQISMLKRGSEGAANAGFEPYSEVFATQVLEAAGVEHVPYSVVQYHGKLASKCPLFTNEDEGFVAAYRMLDGRVTTSSMLNFTREHGCEEQFREMVVMDAIMLNTDRHTGNYGFLVDNDTGEVKGMAPLFDHNLACLPAMMETDDLEEYISFAAGPKIGRTFESIARELMTSDIRAKLVSLRDFEYENPGQGCPQWRVDMLNTVKERQISAILGSSVIR